MHYPGKKCYQFYVHCFWSRIINNADITSTWAQHCTQIEPGIYKKHRLKPSR